MIVLELGVLMVAGLRLWSLFAKTMWLLCDRTARLVNAHALSDTDLHTYKQEDHMRLG